MLGHLEADWAVTPLTEALKDENELVRRTAHAALKHIGTPEALAALTAHPELPPLATTGILARPPEKVETTTAQPEPAAAAKAEILAEAPAATPVEADKPAPTPAEPSTTPTAVEAGASARPEQQQEAVQPPAESVSTSAAQFPPTPPTPEPVSASTELPADKPPETPVPLVTAGTDLRVPPGNTIEAVQPASDSASAPAAQADKPDWAVEKTRPSRPEGLDEVLRAQTPQANSNADNKPETSSQTDDTPAPVSSDGATPQNTSQTPT
jgi:hypothetical protein